MIHTCVHHRQHRSMALCMQNETPSLNPDNNVTVDTGIHAAYHHLADGRTMYELAELLNSLIPLGWEITCKATVPIETVEQEVEAQLELDFNTIEEFVRR